MTGISVTGIDARYERICSDCDGTGRVASHAWTGWWRRWARPREDAELAGVEWFGSHGERGA